MNISCVVKKGAKRSKAWYEDNKELTKSRSKNSYEKNKKKILARQRKRATELPVRFAKARRNAKKRGLDWTLTLEEFTKLSEKPCFYCSGPTSSTGSGLDRQDHLKGYIPSNVVPCCGFKGGNKRSSCNFRKGHLECAGFQYPRTVELMNELLSKGDNGV